MGLSSSSMGTSSSEQKHSSMVSSINDPEARTFWLSNYGEQMTVPYSMLIAMLAGGFGPFDRITLDTLKMILDEEKKDQVTLYQFQKWVASAGSLRIAIAEASSDLSSKVMAAAAPVTAPSTSVGSGGISTTSGSAGITGTVSKESPPPDLMCIWADPNHSTWNSETVGKLTNEFGVKLLLCDNAREAVAFLESHPEYLRSPSLRLMSNNRIYDVTSLQPPCVATILAWMSFEYVASTVVVVVE
jgi:hypothetical protein